MGEASAFSILQNIVGDEVAARVIYELGGTALYVPRRVPVDHETVRNEFERTLPGSANVMSAYEQVAKRHGISIRTVRRIVA